MLPFMTSLADPAAGFGGPWPGCPLDPPVYDFMVYVFGVGGGGGMIRYFFQFECSIVS